MTSTITPAGGLALRGDFEGLVGIVLDTLPALSSVRQYAHTYRLWGEYAAGAGEDPARPTFAGVKRFIEGAVNERTGADLARSTRHARLSHMRRLMTLIAAADPSYKPTAELVAGFMRLQKGAAGESRVRRGLTLLQVEACLAAWSGDAPRERRNAALVAALICTGIRRAEAVAVRWGDVQWADGTIDIHDGKGGKSRVVVIAGDGRLCLDRLGALQRAMPAGREFVFSRLTRGRTPTWECDSPMSLLAVNRAVKATAARAGLDHITPHDLRRTHVTLALRHGSTLADVQAQAGHANAATTLRYAMPALAKQRRIKLGAG